jgi:hypothetical protein
LQHPVRGNCRLTEFRHVKGLFGVAADMRHQWFTKVSSSTLVVIVESPEREKSQKNEKRKAGQHGRVAQFEMLEGVEPDEHAS